MLINSQIITNLCLDAGVLRTQKAKQYKNQGRVEITNVEYEDKNNFEVSALVNGTQKYHTYIQVKMGEVNNIVCDCPDYERTYGVCKHTLATILELETYGQIEQDPHDLLSTPSQRKYANFNQIVNTFYNEEIDKIGKGQDFVSKEEKTISIEPKLLYDPFTNDMKVEFRIGNKRMYKLKSLPEFYEKILNNELYSYGDKLKFVHNRKMFKEDSQDLLNFLLKYSEIIRYANSNSNSNFRYYGKALNESSIMLGNSALDEFFDILKGKTIDYQRVSKDGKIKFIDKDPEIKFTLNKNSEEEYEIVPNIDLFKVNFIKGRKYKYILWENELYRITKEFEKSTMLLIEMFRKNYLTEILLGKNDLKQLFSIIVPRVNDAIFLGNVQEEEVQKYRPKKIITKVFLDFDSNDYLVAEVRFDYEGTQINPLNENEKTDIPRNILEEAKILNVFKKTGFMYDVKNLRFILPENDKIYNFLTNDITYYMQKFDVMVTDNFKTKEITKPKIGALGIKIENDLLTIDLSKLNIDAKELKNVMEQYHLKKKYHRLKDGSFLSLEENQEVEFIDKLVSGMNVGYKEIEKGEIRLPVNRTLYLNQLLNTLKGTQISKNDEYKNMVRDLSKDIEPDAIVPSNLKADLRYYQKTGFKWLSVLDHYHFGGILADDIGLGKTIQILAIILKYVNEIKLEDAQEIENKEKRKTSIVISPSSLTLNWYNEAKKFAPDLKVQVIGGTAKERREKIENLDNYDLIITSYDLLKRDIDIYKNKKYKFRFAIADEAQYLKNSNTQNAKTIKSVIAQTKFALTGTPIENSLAELWSIFDFIMPGYLFSYKEFKSSYEGPIVKDQDEIATKN